MTNLFYSIKIYIKGLNSDIDEMISIINKFNTMDANKQILLYNFSKSFMYVFLKTNKKISKGNDPLLNDIIFYISETSKHLNQNEIKQSITVESFNQTNIEDCLNTIRNLPEKYKIDSEKINNFLDWNEFDDLDDNELLDIFKDLPESNPTENSNSYCSSLIGVQELEEELQKLSKYSNVRNQLNMTFNSRRVFPIHYIFEMDCGMGVTTILSAFTENLHKLNLIKNNTFIEIKNNIS